MIALAIIGAILLLIIVILLLPVGVQFQYNNEFHLWLKYGPISIKLIPGKSKSQKEKTNKKKIKKNPKDNKKKKKKLPTFIDIISSIEKAIKELGAFLKKLKFKRFNAAIVISGSDAATAAINYGRACAAATALYTTLEKSLDPHNTNISVDLEYDSKTTAELDIIINTLTINVIILAIKILIIILPLITDDKKKGGKNNEHR